MVTSRKGGFSAGVLVALLFGVGCTAAFAQQTDGLIAITDAVIFDGTGKEPYRGTVIVRDGRIANVGQDVAVPAGAKIIRAEGRALLPGFFDVHTHWSPGGQPGSLPQIATAYITSGVTTVNDFHQPPEAFAPRRDWLKQIKAPHVNFVARMSTPGGHGADWADRNTTKWVATAQSARREVKALQPYQPDYIKAFADGWRYGNLPEETSMNLETLGALVDEAHKQGQRVLTHTVTVDRGKLAAQAGVDVIAHSLQDKPVDDEVVALMRKAGTYYAPTLAIYEPSPGADRIVPDLTDAAARQRYRKWDYAKQNLRVLYQAGIPIAVGTDAGIGGARHGASTLREMELMVDAGLPPAAALIAATANSAKALGVIGDRGTIEAGKRADLVVIAGKPWQNIADVRNIHQVVIDGDLVIDPRVKLPKANSETALAADPAAELIDDFERTDDRSSLDTLRLADMDGGVERSAVVTNRVPRATGGAALAIAVQMALKDGAEGGVLIPLRRGSVRPVDARKFAGIKLEFRGAGPYQVVINTLNGEWTAELEAGADWTEIRVPFTSFKPTASRQANVKEWRGNDLIEVGVLARRAAGATAWAEVDNISFY